MAGAMCAWFAHGDTAGGNVRHQAGYPSAVMNSIVSFVGLVLALGWQSGDSGSVETPQ